MGRCKELDLNQRPSAYRADAQPSELSLRVWSERLDAVAPRTGIEPVSPARQAGRDPSRVTRQKLCGESEAPPELGFLLMPALQQANRSEEKDRPWMRSRTTWKMRF